MLEATGSGFDGRSRVTRIAFVFQHRDVLALETTGWSFKRPSRGIVSVVILQAKEIVDVLQLDGWHRWISDSDAVPIFRD